jgi:ubiquinol-cytochrome c reductase cytochrome b subunit
VKKLFDALDQRIGHKKLIHEALYEPMPGGASFAYVFGSGALILFAVQVVTGIVLAMYYSPSSTDAWASVAYLERSITMGAVVRGLHHWSAGGMVIIVVLHMLQVALFGAYKAPREANWLSGLGLLGLVLGFALTGYLLPWDQTGYWATKVATSIAGTIPMIGPELQRIAQGGNDYGNLTLTRFYALHVVVLPILTLGLIGAHLALFRKHGVTPKASMSNAALEAKKDFFFPKQVALDAVFAFVVIIIISFLAVREGAPLQAPADPSSNFIARPEWYFLFLFQLLKYFQGPAQIVGTVVIPGAVATFLVLLPFLDRGESRRVAARKIFIGALFLGLASIAALTALAIHHDQNDPTIAVQQVVAAREAERARELAANGVPTEGAAFMMAHDPLTRGERVFARECASCHVLEGLGPKEPKGPELTAYASKAWIRQVLRDADSPRLFGRTKIEGMESYAGLDPADLNKLVDIVYLQRDEKAPPLAERPGAELLESQECTDCHELASYDAVEGPALFRYLSAEWIRQVVDDPSAMHLYADDNEMPVFKTRISEEDRSAVVVFLQSLEHRGSADTWPHVDDPGPVPSPRTKTSTATKK